MKKKRIAGLMLCAALALSAVMTGCGKTEEKKVSEKNADGTYKDFITVDVFDTLANYQGIQSGWFAKIVKDKFNMELNIIAPNVAGGGDTLFQTRSTAGNLGDLIISKTGDGRFQDMVTAGLLTDMSDLLKDKDILKNYKQAIDKTNSLVEQEGIWGIPGAISNQAPTVPGDGLEPLVAPYVRWDAYEKIGYPEVKNFDDFLEVLKQIQETIPTSDSGKKTYALSFFKDWDGNMMVNAKNYASLYGYDEIGFVMAKADGSDFQDVMDENGVYVEALKFFFKANKEGLVDPESTTQNYDILSDKYRDGQILSSIWPWQGASYYNTVEHKEEGKGFMPLMMDGTSCLTFGCYSQGNSASVMAIGSQAKDPQRLADFIDWLYSPEGVEASGQSLGGSGPEGLTWEMKDGKPVLTEFGEKALPSNTVEVPEEWGGGLWKDGVSALNFQTVSAGDTDPKTGEPYRTSMWESQLAKNNTPLDLSWQKYAGGAKSTMELLISRNALSVIPGTSWVTPAESSDIATIRSQCRSVIIDSSWRMIFANDEAEFNSILKEMQDTAKGLGYADVFEVDMTNAKSQTEARQSAITEFESRNK